MAIKVTVRIGGDAGSTTWNATSQVRVFGDDSAPLLTASHRYDMGASSQFEFEVDDDVGEIPRVDLTKNLASHNVVIVSENASGTEYWTARGRIADKGWGRGDKPWGDSRAASVRVDDGNIDLKGLNLTAHWDRPAESGRARTLAALAAFCNGSPRLTTVIGIHLVAAGGEVTMPAKKYLAGAPLGEILEDCAAVEGKVGGVVLHHSGGSHLCYLYIDEDDHTTYLSTYRITDTSPNLTTQYPPQWEQGDATVEMGGENPISTLVSRHGQGDDSFVVSTDTTIITAYDYWAETFNDSTSVTAAQAQRRADSTRRYRGREHVTHQVTIQVRADEVHLVEAGMSIEIRAAAAMAGQYLGTVQTRRIAQCKKEPIAPDVGAVVGFYNLHLMLDRPQKILPERVGLPVGPKPAVSVPPAEGGDFVNGRSDSNFGVHSLASWGDIAALPDTVLFIFIHVGPDVDPDAIAISCSDGRTAVAIPSSRLVNGSWGQKAFYIVDPANSQTFTRTPNTGYCSFALFQNVDQFNPVLTLLTATGTSAVAALGTFNGLNSMYAYGGGADSIPNETTGQTEFSPSASQGYYFTEWGMSYGIGAPSWALTNASKQWTIIGIGPKLAGTGSVVVTEPVGGTGTGTPGTPDGTFVGPAHVHEHGNITTGGPYHMAEDVSFAPTGTIAATNTQAAVAEVATEYVAADTAHAAAADPHAGYVREAEFTAAADSLVGTGSGTLTKRKHNESATVAPAVGNDSSQGYSIGSHWIDTTADKEYVALDVSVGVAVWKERTAGAGGLADQGTFTYLDAAEAAAPATPAAGKVRVYAKADGLLYSKDDAGVETVVTGGAASTGDHNHTTAGGDGGDLDGARIGDFTEYTEVAAPSTPAAGLVRVYAKSDGKLYIKDDVGTETDLAAGGGGGGAASPEWWHSDNAPGSPDAANREFTAALSDTRVAHGTPKGTWAQVADGAEWTHTATGATDLDVWAIARTCSVGDYVTLAGRYPPYVPNHMGIFVGFANGTTFGTSNAVGVDAHLTGSTYRHVMNSFPGFNSRGADSSFQDFGIGGQVYGWRVKYEAANTWGLYIRAPGTSVWRKVTSTYAYTMTPTHVVFGVGMLLSPVYSADNGAGIRLECFRVND